MRTELCGAPRAAMSEVGGRAGLPPRLGLVTQLPPGCSTVGAPEMPAIPCLGFPESSLQRLELGHRPVVPTQKVLALSHPEPVVDDQVMTSDARRVWLGLVSRLQSVSAPAFSRSRACRSLSSVPLGCI